MLQIATSLDLAVQENPSASLVFPALGPRWESADQNVDAGSDTQCAAATAVTTLPDSDDYEVVPAGTVGWATW